jgi:hypothetical protein
MKENRKMRLKHFISCAVVAFTLLCAVGARAQGQQPEGELVRGAFITTRPAATQESKKETASVATAPANKTPPKTASNTPPRRRNSKGGKTTQRQVAHANANAKPNTTPNAPTETANNAGGPKFSKAGFKPDGIGIGYTLFRRDETGAAVRVDPKREFKSGEAIRLLVESNADGYLYIFDAENDATPSLIFPNAKLKGGDNHISAHVPYEIPSSGESDESLRWFVFNESPATERVYVVVSRKPLEGVPVGERLVNYCAGKDQTCAWKPTGDQWLRLKGLNRRDEIAMSRVQDEGLFQTTAEHEAVSRGLGLSASAPPPSVIYMASSADANVLITTVDLIHKK